MLVECHNCGAPLDVTQNASVVKCNYCGTSAKTTKQKTVALETPKDWKPPTEWKPPDGSTLGEVLVYKPVVKAARAVITSIAVSGVAMAAIGGFIAYQVSSTVDSTTKAALAGLNQPQVGDQIA